MNKPRFLIGIDPGANTGFALYDRELGELVQVTSYPHELAKGQTDELLNDAEVISYGVEVYVEDARQARGYFAKFPERKIGAGMVQQKCADWEYWLTSRGALFHMVPPRKGATKWQSHRFKMATGWGHRSNEHGRDAAMLIWGR